MPAAPELAHGLRDVGEVEVLEELEAEHLAEPDRHVRVAREVEVDLQRVADDAEPGERGVESSSGPAQHWVSYVVIRRFRLLSPGATTSFNVAFHDLLRVCLGRVRLADVSGVLSGILMGFLIVSFTDFRWFVLILSFFVIGGSLQM